MNSTVTIIKFQDQYARDFANLNYEWLEKYFVIEAHDTEMLEQPKEYIIDKGGEIFLAKMVFRQIHFTIFRKFNSA